jgi:hypothetical protein
MIVRQPPIKTKRSVVGAGPLIAAKQAEMFPSLERSAKNQSELSLLKLPDIAQAQINVSNQGMGILKRVSGRQQPPHYNVGIPI